MESAYFETDRRVVRIGDRRSGRDDLAAFGGAGPMSACGAAQLDRSASVLIPKMAAVFSAFGIGFSDIAQVL